MNARRCGLAGLLASLLPGIACAQWAGDTNLPVTATRHRAVSSSRQFVAYAPQPLWASALCVFAERVKRRWRSELNVTNDWRDPILLNVESLAATNAVRPAIELRIFQTDVGLKYQIDCRIPPPLNEAELATSIVEALCAEVANRGAPVTRNAGYVAPTMPAWLAPGLAQLLEDRVEVSLGVLRRSVEAGRPLTAGALFETEREPAREDDRLLFRAKAGLFVEGLLVLPRGDEKMQRFLAGLGATKSVSNAFWTTYGGDFDKPVALEKWWFVRLAERTRFDVAQALTTAETLRQLEPVLQTRLTGGKSFDGAELPNYRKEKWYVPLLESKRRSLRSLRGRALPRDAALIDRYLAAMQLLLDQRSKEFPAAWAAAEQVRRDRDARARAEAAYLDEAERIYAAGDVTGIFDGYFRALDEFQKLDEQRRDPISDYLDQFGE